MPERALPVKTCTYHCASCGRHFHSLEAFDVHRVGDHAAPIGSDEGRRCAAPIDLLDKKHHARLVALTEHGECRIYSLQRDIVIWTMAGTLERMAEWRAKASESPSAAP